MENDLFSEVFDGAIESYIDPNAPTEEEQAFNNEEREVNPSLKTDIDNLLVHGSISKEVELAGHTFVIRTLTIGEELSIALIVADYENNFAQAKAIAAATVAASLQYVDGRELMHNLGPDPTINIRQKFAYIRNKWYWTIIEELYQHYLVLIDRQIAAFQELKGK